MDKIEEKDITKQYHEKFRNHSSELIKQNKINKCFEVSAKTGEGIDNLVKHLKLDCSIIAYNKKNKILKSKDKLKKIIYLTKIKNGMKKMNLILK